MLKWIIKLWSSYFKSVCLQPAISTLFSAPFFFLIWFLILMEVSPYRFLLGSENVLEHRSSARVTPSFNSLKLPSWSASASILVMQFLGPSFWYKFLLERSHCTVVERISSWCWRGHPGYRTAQLVCCSSLSCSVHQTLPFPHSCGMCGPLGFDYCLISVRAANHLQSRFQVVLIHICDFALCDGISQEKCFYSCWYVNLQVRLPD